MNTSLTKDHTLHYTSRYQQCSIWWHLVSALVTKAMYYPYEGTIMVRSSTKFRLYSIQSGPIMLENIYSVQVEVVCAVDVLWVLSLQLVHGHVCRFKGFSGLTYWPQTGPYLSREPSFDPKIEQPISQDWSTLFQHPNSISPILGVFQQERQDFWPNTGPNIFPLDQRPSTQLHYLN